MTGAEHEKLRRMCPKHSRKKKSDQRGFRCVCVVLGVAFYMGYDNAKFKFRERLRRVR